MKEVIMGKEQLLKYLEEGLKHVLGLRLDPESQEAVETAVKMFIIEDASKYSEQELISNFSTMEKGLSRFMHYLETSVMADKGSITLH